MVLFIGAFHHQERVPDSQLRGSLPQVPHLSIGKYELAEHPSKKKAWFHYLITPRACKVEPITPDRATPVALEAFVPHANQYEKEVVTSDK